MNHLLWDFDGTLSYREGMWSGAMTDLLHREIPSMADVEAGHVSRYLQSGFPWHAPEDPHTEISTPEEWWAEMHPVLANAYEEVGVPDSRSRILAEGVKDVYLDPSQWELYEDTVATLTGLSENGWTHHILSNHVPELPILVESLGLDRHFETVHTSALTGFEKPHPRAFEIALESIGEYDQVYMVGDSVRADIVGAEEVGIPAILVRNADEAASHQARSLRRLPELLQSEGSE